MATSYILAQSLNKLLTETLCSALRLASRNQSLETSNRNLFPSSKWPKTAVSNLTEINLACNQTSSCPLILVSGTAARPRVNGQTRRHSDLSRQKS